MSDALSYEQFLATKGISLQQIGLRDIALRRLDALSAIEILRALSIPIVGGDVYFTNDGHIEIAYANWYTDREVNESMSAYLERCYQQTKKYIMTFTQRAGMDAIFVLVTGSPSS